LNGGGKSTLLAVIARLVDFSSGSYYVNGVDTRRMNATELHARTSAIFQSFCKFEQTSVRENAGVGDVASLSSTSSESGLDADDRIWQALECAGAKKFVEDFPDDLETLLEVDGIGRTKHFHHLQHYNHPPPPYASTSLQLQGLHSVHGTPDSLSIDGDVGNARLSGGQVRKDVTAAFAFADPTIMV
jgi:ABC-type glutathione transport system ATPase component